MGALRGSALSVPVRVNVKGSSFTLVRPDNVCLTFFKPFWALGMHAATTLFLLEQTMFSIESAAVQHFNIIGKLSLIGACFA